MRAFTLLAALVVLVGGLAGCIGSSSSPTKTSPSSPASGSALSPASATPSSSSPASSTPSASSGGVSPAANATTIAPRVVTASWNGTTTGVGQCDSNAVGLCVGYVNGGPTDSNVQVSFPVEKGATAIEVVLTWPDATNDLDPQLTAPDYKQDTTPNASTDGVSFIEGHYWSNTNGSAGSGDSPAKIVLTEAKALGMTGKWGVYVGAKLANQEAFKLVVSVYYGGKPPTK